MELFEEIRREYRFGVGTIQGVAKKLNTHRRMVRQALASAIPPERKTPARSSPKLGPVREFIDGILQSDQQAPRKQRHTAHRIWVRIREERPEACVAEATVRRYLFVIDGAKTLRAAIKRVFGERAEVQRCQLHKRRNVKEYLPKNAQGDYDRRIRNAYATTGYVDAKAELEKIFRQLERVNPSAARSLEEGLEETLTVHRLGLGEFRRRSLATTNPIESCLSTVERVAHNVKRWHGGDQPLRWTATGLLEAERKFRKVKGFRELAPLHRQLNPQCACEACKRWRLTQQAQVA